MIEINTMEQGVSFTPAVILVDIPSHLQPGNTVEYSIGIKCPLV